MGDALAVGTLLVALLATSNPVAPTPEPSAAPLREIGHVHAVTPLCRALVARAVDAVEVETANDRRLEDAETAMRTLDFDASPLTKYRSTRAIEERFIALRAASVGGIATMNAFRDDAKAATDDEQRRALASFADALAGAIYRQKVLADDLGRFVAYLDAHDAIDPETHDRMTFEAIASQNVLGGPAYVNDNSLGASTARDFGVAHAAPVRGATSGLASALDTVPSPLSAVAKDGASEIAKRARPIADDERSASALIDPAFKGC